MEARRRSDKTAASTVTDGFAHLSERKSLNTSSSASGFSLRDLIVVVAVVGILVFIILPTCSTSRRHGRWRYLGSRSASFRNLAYGALAYANDWKDVLPSFSPGDVSDWNDWNTWYSEENENRRNLHTWSRLPIVGFDTTTSVNPVHTQQGGLAVMMRDYLKNEWNIPIGYGGWFDERASVVPDDPRVPTGTLYLAHRPPSEKDIGNPYIDPNIPKLGGDPSKWKLFTDMTIITGTAIADPLRIASNHFNKVRKYEGSTFPEDWPEILSLDTDDNSEAFPKGGMVARLDASVRWHEWDSFEPRYYFEFKSRPARYWWGSDSNTKSTSW